ncbi:MAG: hypothetical protein KDH20_17165 [Rhodocyclaceae bacterium]|nr:hypothetical protein [Rhodocyclaceae bacterium]
MLVATSLMERFTPRFFNANFCEAASRDGWQAYRGEIALKEGEVADAQGRRKPPVNVLKQVILLTAGDELKLVAGSLDELQEYPLIEETFGDALKAGTTAVLFTVNIPEPFQTTVNGATLYFIPMVQGMVWTELADLVALEKSDFKGQSAADKVVTLYDAVATHDFKLPPSTLEAALATTNDARRENHGAI